MSGFKLIAKKGAPEWLYGWYNAEGKLTSYWVRYRKEGLKLQEKIENLLPNATWTEAKKAGQDLVDEARGAKKLGKEAPSMVRSEAICDELVRLRKAKAGATYEQIESMMRNHLIPWFNKNCPYASGVNSTHWDQYKSDFRLAHPTGALFNHWKFFGMFAKACFEKGLIKSKLRLDFDEKREDFRKPGQVIPSEHLNLITRKASRTWRCRIRVQRLAGMRPGEVRCLQKDRVDLQTGIVNLRAEDTKTRMPRSFKLPRRALRALRIAGAVHPDSRFFFPARGLPSQPMDRGLGGWEAAIEAANKAIERAAPAGTKPILIRTDYTPHDIRHTYLTIMFKTGISAARICYAAGLSIEEAQKTYLHFTAEDTVDIAESAVRLSFVIGKKLVSEVTQAEDNTR